ncbi:MAG: toll/interleukin-1 receptor domain-containing protein, partial [Chloroflexi bacterium]|nr:toll/interleukin-1 receptor domain-containing protein [Chloroflexota bacterium]
MSTIPNEPLRLFYSYAHVDDALRADLVKHLSNLQQQGYIAPWHDRDISAGQDWERAIDENLTHAHIILLLISKHFLTSRYRSSIEMQRALERHKAGEALVIPIILSFVDWQGSPFSKLQVLPTDGKPIISSHWHNPDEAFTHVA